MRPKPDRCPLLGIPPELRDLIFEYALKSEKTLVSFRLDDYQRDSFAQAVQPALTKVSQQIRRESIPLWYSCNDFVLHSEAAKANDARKWLLCNETQLPKLRQISFWMRYVTLENRVKSANGAICITLKRVNLSSDWTVDDEWRWITVVRKPEALERDAKFLIEHLRQLLQEDWPDKLSVAGIHGLLTDLREGYVKEKAA